MKAFPNILRLLCLFAAVTAFTWQARAEDKSPPETAKPGQEEHADKTPAVSDDADKSDSPTRELSTTQEENHSESTQKPDTQKPSKKKKRVHSRGQSSDIPFGDIHVPAGESRSEAVSVFGSTKVDGTVNGDAVAVMGNNTINGLVTSDAVAVMGNLTVDGTIEGDAVAVCGNVILGPKAEVQGDTVAVLGKVIRSEGAKTGNTQSISPIPGLSDFGDITTYFHKCLMRGRLLGFGEGLRWAWLVAAAHLGFYIFLTLVLAKPTEKCISVLEEKPGMSILSAMLAFLLTPLLIILLSLTVVGAVLIPFLVLAMFFAGLFGRAVMHAWFGRLFTRFLGDSPLNHVAFATLVGGVLISLIYCVPVIAFIVHSAFGAVGFGVVVYALSQSLKREKKATPPSSPLEPSPAAVGASYSAAAAVPFAVPSAIPVETTPVTESVPPPIAEFASPVPTAQAATPPAPAAFAAPAAKASFEMPLPGTKAAATEPSAAELPRATFKQRMLALIIDIILVLIIIQLVDYVTPSFLKNHFSSSPLTFMVPMAVYGAILWKLKATTVGGTVFKLQVVRNDGRPLDWTICIVRGIGAILSAFCIGIGFIWIAFDPEKESWHDKIAGTAVVVLPKRKPLV